jgi:hypothetical protein
MLVLIRVVQEILRRDNFNLRLAVIVVLLAIIFQITLLARLLLFVHLLMELALHLQYLIVAALHQWALRHEFQTITVGRHLKFNFR